MLKKKTTDEEFGSAECTCQSLNGNGSSSTENLIRFFELLLEIDQKRGRDDSVDK
ncbi:hypothetical protein ACFLUO_07215 [Chloroflexota bacterium]